MAPAPGAPQPTVRPTAWRTVALAAVLGVAIGWLGLAGLETAGLALPRLPLVAVAPLAAFTLVVAWLAVRTHRTIHLQRATLPAQRAVWLLALGRTALLAGSGLAGAYAAVVVQALPRWEAALPRERLITAGLTLAACLALAVAGYRLERACRIPDPPSGEDNDATPPRHTDSGPEPG
ncbi:MAG: DUF3180 domain-containing protein [Propionibacteriaceae bacterium]|nr:DUF3180 domain-containing protein [Propionibacteriaceae bacterium]